MTAAELRGANKPSLNEALGWVGSRVDDIYGAGVGRLEDVWIDPGTGIPRWLLVKEGRFGGRTTLIPFEDATAGAGHVWIPYERDVVRDAPVVQPGAPLTQQLETALRKNYAAAAPHKHQDPTTAAAAGAAARLAQRVPLPEPTAVAGVDADRGGDRLPPQGAQHADAVSDPHAAVESTPPAAYGAPMHAPAAPRPQLRTPQYQPPVQAVPPPPASQPHADRPAPFAPSPSQRPRAPEPARQFPPTPSQPIFNPAPSTSPAQRPQAHAPAQPTPPPQATRPPQAHAPAQPTPPPLQVPAGGYQPHPTQQPALQFAPAPAATAEPDEAERLTAVPVIHGLDRPYRVEVELNGSIKVSGELTAFSLTPSEGDQT